MHAAAPHTMGTAPEIRMSVCMCVCVCVCVCVCICILLCVCVCVCLQMSLSLGRAPLCDKHPFGGTPLSCYTSKMRQLSVCVCVSGVLNTPDFLRHNINKH